MKTYILFLFTCLSVNPYSFAENTSFMEKRCSESDVKVELKAGRDFLEPREVYVKENDRVCLFVSAVDMAVAITIDKYPVRLSAPTGKTSDYEIFKADKTGSFKIQCKRGCAYDVESKLVVQTKAEFDRFDRVDYRKKSRDYRKNNYNRNYRD